MHNFLLNVSPLWTKQIISDISLYFSTVFTCCSGVNSSQLVHPVFPHVTLMSL